MVTKYKYVNYEFNHVAWTKAMIIVVANDDTRTVAELLGLSESIILNWSRGRYTDGFMYPNMTNFLKVCNLFEMSPHEFFTTSE